MAFMWATPPSTPDLCRIAFFNAVLPSPSMRRATTRESGASDSSVLNSRASENAFMQRFRARAAVESSDTDWSLSPMFSADFRAACASWRGCAALVCYIAMLCIWTCRMCDPLCGTKHDRANFMILPFMTHVCCMSSL